MQKFTEKNVNLYCHARKQVQSTCEYVLNFTLQEHCL